MCILDDRNDPTRLSINVNFNCSAFTLNPYFRCFGIRMYVVTGWWFGTCFIVPYTVIIGNVIIPTEFHIFQRGRSTTNQHLNIGLNMHCFKVSL